MTRSSADTPVASLNRVMISALAVAALLCGAYTASADGAGNADILPGQGCMQDTAGFGLNCTANDIRLASVANLLILDDGCSAPGDTVSFTADFEVLLTAQARHDIGIWFAQDGDPNGDGAVTGSCTAATPAYGPDPPWLDLDGTGDDPGGAIQDTCGDINSTHNPLFPSVTLTVTCVDDDGNGQLDLPNCTSWRQPGANDLCTSPAQAFPGAPSKCRCDIGFGVPIDVPGQIVVDKVAFDADGGPLPGDETPFDFSITGPDSDLPDNFQLAAADAPHPSPGLDAGSGYSLTESAPDGWEVVSANCVSDQGNSDQDPTLVNLTVNPGETLTCTFENRILPIPELTLVKTASPTTYSAVGDVIDYSYLVTNTGNVSLAGPVTVADDKATDESCPDVATAGDLDGFLDPGESVTCSASYTITQADLDTGFVTNVAMANADGTDSNEDDETVNAVRSPGIQIVKTPTPTTYSSVGDVITYSFLVTCTGNVTLTAVLVSDPLVSPIDCEDGEVPEGSNNPIPILAPDESVLCSGTYAITQADLDSGSVPNTATAAGNDPEGNPVSDTDSAQVDANQSPALTLVKTADPLTYSAVDEVIGYSYLVTNSGNVSLAGPVTVADDKATDESCPDVSTVGNGDGFLDPGESVTCTASYTITQADLNAGSVTNVATASADGTNSNPDEETVTANQSPALTLVKTADPLTYSAVDEVIGYSYLVTNSGNVSLAGPVTVADDKATDESCPDVSTVGNGDGFLDPGESVTCTASLHDHAGGSERRVGDQRGHGECGWNELEPGRGDGDGDAVSGADAGEDAPIR